MKSAALDSKSIFLTAAAVASASLLFSDTSAAFTSSAMHSKKNAVITLSNSTQVNISTLFSGAVWSSSKTKRVIIPAGVTIGSNSAAAPALRTGTGRGGKLIIQNAGSIQGAGGTGGTWGTAGATGATGAAGNAGSGTAGSSGGAAGYAIQNPGNVSLTNSGTISGN